MNTRDHLDSALRPAERAPAAFAASAAQLGHIDLAGDFVVDPGELRLLITHGAAESLGARVRVVGGRRPLASGERAFFSDVRVDRMRG
jgi:hypothetical protein